MVGILIILLGVAWAVWPSSKESGRAKGTVAEGTDGKKSHKGDGKKHGKKKKNGDKKGGGKKSDTESDKAE